MMNKNKSNIQALITTGKDKFYSNGLDLEWLGGSGAKDREAFMSAFNALCVRILTFPMPTIAALNGHAFAGGAMLALCHDYRVMRTGRGWICLNEIDLKMRFTRFMLNLIQSKVKSSIVETDMLVMGKRFAADDALTAGLVTLITGPDQLIEKSAGLAELVIGANGYDRGAMKDMKRDVYARVVALEQMLRGKDAAAKLDLSDLISKL
ncbi:enoyl-CoA delta isomerase 3-like [Lingula anatina]|uniref:Enoyl-CoA delta isomerase 3-like n=1 Tax=Lingula anatina TaxID=7574 RepID=A0A1S3HP79_LINAN|nr:enoyl-CoA delta isomerase 3-like [Lingula anatina]|eukprot:XP_013387858.1 enoyl-CoA delta isomerase 3-like [Lingula anatina]